MNKILRQAIMKWTRLKNIANKTKDENVVNRYEKQRKRVVQLNKRAKKTSSKSLTPLKWLTTKYSGNGQAITF